MDRLREIFDRNGQSKPLDSDGFVIGLFQIVFGLWLLAPGYSFASIPLAEQNSIISPLLPGNTELILGIIVLIMGLADILCIWFKRYVLLKNMDIASAAYWAFITMSWIITSPHSTAVPVYGFFTLFSVYEFYIWSVYCRNSDLRNKRNIGNI